MELISVERLEGLAFDVRVRRHRVPSDLSPADGGRGDGFTPVELLVGSVGACMAMAVQRWCETCGHGEGDVEASVTFELTRESPKRVKTIVVDLEVPETVPENRRDALRRVIEECPIRETLRNPPQVDVEILVKCAATADPDVRAATNGG